MRSRIAVSTALLAACGSLGGGTGGADDLPNRGVVPYERALLVVSSTTAAEPSAVVRDDRLELYYEDRERLMVQRSEDGVELGAPELVLEGARSPSVVFTGGLYHLVFSSEDGSSILRAESDDGAQFGEPTPVLMKTETFEENGVSSPSLIIAENSVELFYTATDADGIKRIARASGALGEPLGDHRLVLEPGEACLGTDGEATDCWDAEGVDHPEVRRARTATGRVIYRLFYTGVRNGEPGLGFAASFDGLSFERFEDNPVVGDSSVAASQPSNALLDGRYLLYHREDGEDGVGLALRIDDEGVPSELLMP